MLSSIPGWPVPCLIALIAPWLWPGLLASAPPAPVSQWTELITPHCCPASVENSWFGFHFIIVFCIALSLPALFSLPALCSLPDKINSFSPIFPSPSFLNLSKLDFQPLTLRTNWWDNQWTPALSFESAAPCYLLHTGVITGPNDFHNTINDRTRFLKSVIYLQHSHQASQGRLERGCNFKLKKSGQDLICLVANTLLSHGYFHLRPWLGGLKSVMEMNWGSAGRKHGCHQQPNPFSVMGA